jgi:hypothetical protein
MTGGCPECARKDALLRNMLQVIARSAGGTVAEVKRLAVDALGALEP